MEGADGEGETRRREVAGGGGGGGGWDKKSNFTIKRALYQSI